MLSFLAWLAFVILSVVALWAIVGYVGLLMWQRYGLVSATDRRAIEFDEVASEPVEKPRRRHRYA